MDKKPTQPVGPEQAPPKRPKPTPKKAQTTAGTNVSSVRNFWAKHRVAIVVVVIALAMVTLLARDFVKFWGQCVVVGWTFGNNVFGILQALLAIIIAIILLVRKLHHDVPWEGAAMKWIGFALLLSFLISTVFVAPFLQFNEKEVAANKMEKQIQELRDKSRPKLFAEILRLANTAGLSDIGVTPIGVTTTFLSNTFGVMITIAVKNTGAPSIAEGFHLDIVHTNGVRTRCVPQMIPPKGIVYKDWVVISPEDSIQAKCAEKPIPEGAKVLGTAIYFVEGNRKQIWHKGAIAELTFRDILGTNYIVRSQPFEAIDSEGQIHYIPGLSRPENIRWPK